MSNIQPHDRFFKGTWERPEVIREFLQNYLPGDVVEQLDLDAIKPLKGSFVDEWLKERFSDLLYKVSLKKGETAFIYILLEHKSFPERLVSFHLLRELAINALPVRRFEAVWSCDILAATHADLFCQKSI